MLLGLGSTLPILLANTAIANVSVPIKRSNGRRAFLAYAFTFADVVLVDVIVVDIVVFFFVIISIIVVVVVVVIIVIFFVFVFVAQHRHERCGIEPDPQECKFPIQAIAAATSVACL
jgi:membrane protein YdbS with pleckstrin-like domain